MPLYASKYIDIPMYQQYADPKLTGFFRENLSILGPHTVQMYIAGKSNTPFYRSTFFEI